jgi:hypothetical protein
MKISFITEQYVLLFADVILSTKSFFTKDINIETKSGFCDDTTVAGNDLPDKRTINFGGSKRKLRFSFNTYRVKDHVLEFKLRNQ